MPRRTVMVGVCVLLLASACGGGPVGSVTDADAIPELDLYEQPIADAPDPADRAGAASNYVECSYGIWSGGWALDYGPTGTGSDPEQAMARFLDEDLFGLPATGYALTGRDTDRVLYTYAVDGASKVAVIAARSEAVGFDELASGWVVETFATCDPAEFDPSSDDEISVKVWRDADDNRVPTSIINSLQGAEHCGWESVTYLTYQDRTYVSDPNDMMDVPFVGTFDDNAELPPDAVDTGYQRDDRELWISADGAIAYLVGDDRVEAWPAPEDPDSIWCD
ncbi:MAG: hypothetical protein WB245_11910 [Acidimicrobiia bacterium]